MFEKLVVYKLLQVTKSLVNSCPLLLITRSKHKPANIKLSEFFCYKLIQFHCGARATPTSSMIWSRLVPQLTSRHQTICKKASASTLSVSQVTFCHHSCPLERVHSGHMLSPAQFLTHNCFSMSRMAVILSLSIDSSHCRSVWICPFSVSFRLVCVYSSNSKI